MDVTFPAFLIFVLLVGWQTRSTSFPDEDKRLLLAGLTDIKHETIDAPVVLESGKVPTWLNGNFIRHSCGVFGETEHMSDNPLNYISHLFDCMEMGSKFKLENGVITFTNRWYDTVANDFYNLYGRDMNKSSNFLTAGAYSEPNATQVEKYREMTKQESNKVPEVPHVSWWQIGNEAVAMTESPHGVIIDPGSVRQQGYVPYTDDNLGFGYKDSVVLLLNPAHEHTDKDGTVWSTVSVAEFTSRTTLRQWQVVYKVGANKTRIAVGKYPFGEVDLTRCDLTKPNTPYPDMNVRYGYMHSFSMTEHFVILPMTAYLFDPCSFARKDDDLPFFKRFFKFEPNGPSRLLVMNRADGTFVKEIETQPFFATHQLGSYEDGDLLHMDMLTYKDTAIYSRNTYVKALLSQLGSYEDGDLLHMDMLTYKDTAIYSRNTYVKALLSQNVYTTDVTRITINRSDWSHSFKNLRRDAAPQAFEMSNINYEYNTQKYTYAYMLRNFDRIDQNAVTKLNVDTSVELEYVFPKGMFPQEPQFVKSPNAVFEDDGVILSQGIDGVKNKAFMVILDARTMKLIAHVTAPGRALFGLHNRFYPFSVGQPTIPAVGVFG